MVRLEEALELKWMVHRKEARVDALAREAKLILNPTPALPGYNIQAFWLNGGSVLKEGEDSKNIQEFK